MQLPSIIIVDDHQIFRRSLKSLIVNERIGNVIGEASNGKEFLEIITDTMPDIVLMDIDMPIMNGIDATKMAIEKYPEIKILVLSMFGDENYYNQMVEAGVKGFLLKSSDIKELENAIYMVHEGKSYFSNELLQSIINNFNIKKANNINNPDIAILTEREMDVLKLICKGLTNDKIAEQLHISPKTVKGHRANLLDKTGCNNSTSMVIYSIKHKIIEL